MNRSNSTHLRLDRRRFLQLGTASVAGAWAGGWLHPASAFAYGAEGKLYRSLVPEGATFADKGIDADWLASLRQRESAEPVFTKAANELRYIGMPCGGIGCGTLYLGGDGRLWLWDVWHHSGEGIRPRNRHHHSPNGSSRNYANRDGVNYFSPIDAWNDSPPADERPFPLDQGFVLRCETSGTQAVHRLDRRDFANISFRGIYPVAQVDYADPGCPLAVSLTAHPIFIPLNTGDSSLPITILEYQLHNPGDTEVAATLLGWLENPVLMASGLSTGRVRVNELKSGSGFGFLECRTAGTDESPFVKNEEYTVIADFEGEDYGDWEVTGDAFGTGPVEIPSPTHSSVPLRDVRGIGLKYVNSYLGNGGSDALTGTLTSPAFVVSQKFIHFLLGGGEVRGIQVRLFDAATGETLRTTTNSASTNTMQWQSWDVTDLSGRSVRIVVEDLASGSWGQIGFDHVCFSNRTVPPEYLVFEDFERETYAPWTTTGTAFGNGPVRIADLPKDLANVNGIGDRVVNSHASAPGADHREKDSHTGTLVSPEFTITRGYIHWLQGGGNNAEQTRVRLLRATDGAELRIQTGNNQHEMTWRTWDVREFRGERCRISIEDLGTRGWGNVGVDEILFSTNPASPGNINPEGQIDYGTIGIAELGDPTGRVGAAELPSGDFPWLPPVASGCGAIGRTLKVAPGSTATVRFAVAWHFPNLPRALPRNRREYANRFADAYAVAEYVTKDYTRLTGATRLWMDTWKDSSLPYWFLDRALTTSSTLSTENCFLFDNGRFYGYEGINCCPGTCTHVWYYAQALARLFPDIERGLRQNVDLNPAIAQQRDGAIRFRGEFRSGWAWDGQAGVVLRSYREHLLSTDNAFLKEIWEPVKLALDFLIKEDGDQNGVSEKRQHNTLDADLYGRVPAHICLYAAALEAGARMADIIGDDAYAATCRTIAKEARDRMAERYVDAADDPNFGFGYYTHLLTGTTGELGHVQGSYIDQVIGEFYARQLDLPRVTDETQCRNSLRSLWRFNYSHDLTAFLSSSAFRQGRPYQMAGEAGLLICTFPNDGNLWAKSWQSMYFAECMTGFEYQVAAHCIDEGLLDEGFTIMRAVYDRYHPSKRNPFNEVECSDHYARAMASYGAFISISGFRHDGPNGLIGFAPKLGADDFKCAFTAAQGWGGYRRIREGGRIRESIELKYGTMRLRTFECKVPADSVAFLARASHKGANVAAEFTLDGTTLRCTLPEDLNLAVGDAFEIIHATSPHPADTDSNGNGIPDLKEASGF